MDGASGVAGLIGLTGLLIQSAASLCKFCSKYRHLAEKIRGVVDDISRFQSWLNQVKRVTDNVIVKATQHPTALLDFELDIKMCEGDFKSWLHALEMINDTNSERSSKKTAEKLKAAADGGKFTEMRDRIASHRQQLELRLALFNLYASHYALFGVETNKR